MRTATPFVAVVAALLAGCTPMHWERAGTGASVASVDERECRVQASLDAWHYGFNDDAWGFGRQRYVLGLDGKLYPVVDPVPRPLFRRQFLEQNLFQRCMQNRGYHLVPSKPA